MSAQYIMAFGPGLAAIALVCGIAALHWDRVSTRAPNRGAPFVFTPRIVAPLLVLGVQIATAAIVAGLSALTRNVVVIIALPVALLAAGRLVRGVARWWYVRRLRRQVLLAVTQLASMSHATSGIFSAFRAVGRAAPVPLCDEWAWVDAHLGIPYTTPEGQQRVSDHAAALRALASQTPLTLHASVLDHLATIYESGVESQAGVRLKQLAEVLEQQVALQEQLRTLLGKARGTAFIMVGITAMMVVIMFSMQRERFATAFLVSSFAPYAIVYFLFWFFLPLVVAHFVSRSPELPL